MADHSSDEESSVEGEQLRVSLTLADDCADRSLEVSSAPIAVPAKIGRKGLAAIVNHLLDRRLEEEEDKDEEDERLPSLSFDFLVGKSRKLLRTGLEREARRSGLSLETAIEVTYFPAVPAPEEEGASEPLPDWISALSLVDDQLLCAGLYDGSIHVLRPTDNGLGQLGTKTVHQGAIKCLAGTRIGEKRMLVSGSMDHTLQVHSVDDDTYKINLVASCEGHVASIEALDLHGSKLASGDFDGGLLLFDIAAQPEESPEDKQPTKKTRTDTSAQSNTKGVPTLMPLLSIQAHSSKISGISFGNYEKRNEIEDYLVTGSWDHSLKVWNLERSDCLLTLNGSKVVGCLDTSYHSPSIVATGHPDCRVSLWDVRDASAKESSVLTDTTFRPSHSAWISSVRWSKTSPYQITSSSHDGTVKYWDIRSSLPLHTVRVTPKTEKVLSLVLGDKMAYAGGTDCIVKQFACGV